MVAMAAPNCTVDVYPLRVTLEAVKSRESAERGGVWFRADEAAALVEEGGLGLLIKGSQHESEVSVR